ASWSRSPQEIGTPVWPEIFGCCNSKLLLPRRKQMKFAFVGRLEYFFLMGMFVLAASIQTASGASYEDFHVGSLKGKLIVQWWERDKFVFLPDKDDPLTFKRSDGETITPGRMFTDGGSIPRPLWIFRQYSPWGYAPAFIVHDWLFHMKQCGLPGND